MVKADDLNNVLNDYIGKDYVIKSVDGHGGSQVFSLNDDGTKHGSYRKNRDNAKNNIYKALQGHDCVLQKRIDSDSNDIRVYIVLEKYMQPF